MVELDASRSGGEGQGRPFDRDRIRARVSSHKIENRTAIQTALERRGIRYVDHGGTLGISFVKLSSTRESEKGSSRPRSKHRLIEPGVEGRPGALLILCLELDPGRAAALLTRSSLRT